MNIETMIQGNPDALVSTVNGVLVADSLEVAERFGKQHKNVIRDIEKLIYQIETGTYEEVGGSILSHEKLTAENSAAKPDSYFILSEYQNRGKSYRKYLLTRDGFSLLVMGFTGPAALHWKLLYIDAFNKMEAALEKKKELSEMVFSLSRDVLRNVLPEILNDILPEAVKTTGIPTEAGTKPEPTAVQITESPGRCYTSRRAYGLYGNTEALPNLLTVYDVRDFLGMGQRQAYELVRSEGFPKKKIGNTYRIPKQEFIDWLNSQ